MILIVEDDDDLRRIMRWGLEAEGFEVACAADDQQALEIRRILDRSAERMVLTQSHSTALEGPPLKHAVETVLRP